jgi:hypothetical protein
MRNWLKEKLTSEIISVVGRIISSIIGGTIAGLILYYIIKRLQRGEPLF